MCAALGANAGDARAPASYRIAIVSLSSAPANVAVHVVFGDPPGLHSWPHPAPRPPVPSARTRVEVPPRHGRLGERRGFWVRWYDGTGRDRHDAYRRQEAVLALATPHADIWIASDLAGRLRAPILAGLPADVENAYAALHDRFGSLSYAPDEVARHGMVAGCESPDTVRRVARAVPAFVPSRGELLNFLIVPTSAARYGYADTGSYRYQAALNCSGNAKSNELPGLVVWAYERRAPREIVDGTLVYVPAHELQHLQNFVRHAIRTVPSVHQSPLMNEGLSMLAQDFAVRRKFGERFDLFNAGAMAKLFLAQPNAYATLAFAEQDGGVARQFTGGAYGAAYLLQRFLYDRCGDAYLDAVTDTDAVDVAAIERATGMPIALIMRAFARYLLSADARCSACFDLHAHTTNRFGAPYTLTGANATPLPGADFHVVGGSVSLFTSPRPIAGISAPTGNVVWEQTSP